jgi:tetratricopeptide (TPR) repeat protein
VRPQAQPRRGTDQEQAVIADKRIRKFVILPDLLNATGSANLRTVRDTYYLLLGPTSEPNVEAIRRGFLAFVVEPLTDKAVREVTATRDPLKKLLDSRGDKVDPEFKQRSAFFLITDSLVRAIDVRMTVLGLPPRRNYAEIDGTYDLSQAYERGSVLVFHFYDRMASVDSVGINLNQYFSDLLQRIDYEREANRLDEYAQRLTRYKQSKLEAAAAPVPTATIANADEQTVARILSADDLIKSRRYDEARVILEGVHRERPNNARALFGLADVTSKKASQITDSDRLAEQLYAAVELYKQAAESAAPDSERWLAQRSYVAAAKILSFLGESDESGAALELALKLGESADKAAYDEAVKLKQAREQKVQKPQQD